jgi:uncharacterized Zn-binding protein involved in type VI secretion
VGLTVYAEGMGLFHKGSGGQGIAPADVCLSPPPPPAGPVPVPYVNMLSASDLTGGSKSVKIDGEETALEDASSISTSTGDEPGTQGGNVMTAQTKGKGSFTLWSSTVKIEGKGVCRHGDPLGQNSSSTPYGCVDMAAITSFQQKGWKNMGEPCTKKYKRPKEGRPNAAQKKQIEGTACWRAPCTGTATVPDHQPPLAVAWALGGCYNETKFKEWAKSTEATPRGHCRMHSRMQGGELSNISEKLKAIAAVIKAIAGLA